MITKGIMDINGPKLDLLEMPSNMVKKTLPMSKLNLNLEENQNQGYSPRDILPQMGGKKSSFKIRSDS